MRTSTIFKHPGLCLLGVVLLGLAILVLTPSRVIAKSSSLALLRKLTREIPQGHLNGAHHGPAMRANLDILEPGDVILCHNQGGGYGFWTHAVIYVGHGTTVDADDFVRGTILESVDKYRNYDGIAVYRCTASEEVRRKVAAVAMQELGKPYDPFSGIQNSDAEYCSKLIWKSFHKEGISLVTPKHWILPDDVAKSSKLVCIARWGETVPHAMG